jgi:hypothetical protein
METLNESVVQEEHDGSQVPCCFGIPEEHLTNVANIAGFWMPEAELPGRVSEEHSTTGRYCHTRR